MVSRLRELGWQIDWDENGASIAADYGREATGPSAMHLEFVRYATAHRG